MFLRFANVGTSLLNFVDICTAMTQILKLKDPIKEDNNLYLYKACYREKNELDINIVWYVYLLYFNI